MTEPVVVMHVVFFAGFVFGVPFSTWMAMRNKR